MSQPPQAKARRGGWGALICALLILALAGVVVAWLRYTGELDPLLSATPRVEVELPSLDEVPQETAGPTDAAARTAPARTATVAEPPAEESAPGAPTEPGVVTQAALDPDPEPEPVTIPAAPAVPDEETAPADPAPAGTEAQATTTAMAGAALPVWRRFARPFEADAALPRIAVIVAELGLSEAATQEAIARLPADVTLSFSPYSETLQRWIDAARADGHEVMLDLPMEPVGFPRDDPGPKGLFTSLPEAENLARLDDVLGQAEGYVGVVPWMGSRFTGSAEALRPVLRALADRGLMFVDARAAPDSVAAGLARAVKLPRAINDRFLDHEVSRAAIESQLQQVEHRARATGFAVAMASPYPITIERLVQWVGTLERKGLVLAPVSALADKQEEQ